MGANIVRPPFGDLLIDVALRRLARGRRSATSISICCSP
jgi:hypothetical protein